MQIRDAHEGDASAIVALATGDIDPRHLLRERVVRVGVEGDRVDGDRGEEGPIVGFLTFDAHETAVHVTRVAGSDEAVGALLDDAISFARRETLPLEAVVPAGDPTVVALESKGFDSVGSGPRFEGRETTRFRLEPA